MKKCLRCGSSDFTFKNGIYICDYCGVSFEDDFNDKNNF